MSEVFLSASVPVLGRGRYYETANPFLIQFAVRELVMAVVPNHTLVWGGHPAITPMIWTVCEDIGISYAERVVLYQSQFFEDQFPEENARFRNTVLVPQRAGDRNESLREMRTRMFSRKGLRAAVFIGGMDGVEAEFDLFRRFHPDAKTMFVESPGGAAGELAQRERQKGRAQPSTIDFARLFLEQLLPVLDPLR